MKILVTVIVTLGVLLTLAALLAWSGLYNVSALAPETALTQWLLTTVRERSIARQSRHIVPPSLNDAVRVQAGASLYDAMCVSCHSAPGRARSEISQGLYPSPPELSRTRAHRASDTAAYWIVKNGLRMTGMPAFAPTHSEQELWNLVAFLKRLPTLTPEEYATMVHATQASGSHGP